MTESVGSAAVVPVFPSFVDPSLVRGLSPGDWLRSASEERSSLVPFQSSPPSQVSSSRAGGGGPQRIVHELRCVDPVAQTYRWVRLPGPRRAPDRTPVVRVCPLCRASVDILRKVRPYVVRDRCPRCRERWAGVHLPADPPPAMEAMTTDPIPIPTQEEATAAKCNR